MKFRRILAVLTALMLLLSAIPAALAARSDGTASDSYCPASSNNQHNWSEWDPLDHPTCSNEGYGVRVCINCGYALYGTLPKLKHSYGSWRTTKEATCTQEGRRERKCSVCGHVDKDTIDRLAHSWGEWTVIVEPTDFSAGERSHACRVCGTEKTETFYPDGTLRRGDRGDAVKALQQALNDRGYDCGSADGIFGGKTETGVKGFEAANGIEADGIAWPGVIAMLGGGSSGPVTRTPKVPLELSVVHNVNVKSAYMPGEYFGFQWTLKNNGDRDLKLKGIYVNGAKVIDVSDPNDDPGMLAYGEADLLPAGGTLTGTGATNLAGFMISEDVFDVCVTAYADPVDGSGDTVHSNSVPLVFNLASSYFFRILVKAVEPSEGFMYDEGDVLKYECSLDNWDDLELMGGRIEMRVHDHVVDGGLVPPVSPKSYSEDVITQYQITEEDIENGYIDFSFRGIGYVEDGDDLVSELSFRLTGIGVPLDTRLMLTQVEDVAPFAFEAGAEIPVKMTLSAEFSETPLELDAIEGEAGDAIEDADWMHQTLEAGAEYDFEYTVRIRPEEVAQDIISRRVTATAVDEDGLEAKAEALIQLIHKKSGPSLLVVPGDTENLECGFAECVTVPFALVNNGTEDLTFSDFEIGKCGADVGCDDDYILLIPDDNILRAGGVYKGFTHAVCSINDVNYVLNKHTDKEGCFDRWIDAHVVTAGGEEIEEYAFAYIRLRVDDNLQLDDSGGEDIGDMPDIGTSLELTGAPMTPGVYKSGQDYGVLLTVTNAGPDDLKAMYITVTVENAKGEIIEERTVYSEGDTEVFPGGSSVTEEFHMPLPDLAENGHGLTLTFEAEARWWYEEEKIHIPLQAFWEDTISDGTIAKKPGFELVVRPERVKPSYEIGDELVFIGELINRSDFEMAYEFIGRHGGHRGFGRRPGRLVQPGETLKFTFKYQIQPGDIVDGDLSLQFEGILSGDPGSISLRSNPVDLKVSGPGIAIEAGKLPAGDYKAGDDVQVPAKVVNIGTTPLELKGFNCAQYDEVSSEAWMSQPLEPGGVYDMTFTLRVEEDAEGWDHRYVGVRAADIESGEVVEDAALVLIAMSVDEPSVLVIPGDTIGMSAAPGETAFVPVTVFNNGTEAVKILNVESAAPGGFAPGYDACEIPAEYMAGLEPADSFTFDCQVGVTDDDADHGSVARQVTVNAQTLETGVDVSGSCDFAFALTQQEGGWDEYPLPISLEVLNYPTADFATDEYIEVPMRLTNHCDWPVTLTAIQGREDDDYIEEAWMTLPIEPEDHRDFTFRLHLRDGERSDGWAHRLVVVTVETDDNQAGIDGAWVVAADHKEEVSLKVICTDNTPLHGALGDEVPVELFVLNNGTVTLGGFGASSTRKDTGDITDETLTWSTGDAPTLAPGESCSLTAWVRVTKQDAENGLAKRRIEVTAWSSDSNKQKVVAGDDVIFWADFGEEAGGEAPDLELTVTPRTAQTEFAVDDAVIFDMKLTNNTDEDMTYALIWPSDGQGAHRDPYAISTLEAHTGVSFEDEYVFTAADAAMGAITLRFEGRAMDADGERVDAQTLSFDYTVTGGPSALSVSKSIVGTSIGADGYVEGEEIHYVIGVTNNTDAPMGEVEVYDPLHGSNEDMMLDILFSIAPHETRNVTMDYTVTAEDVARGYVENTALAMWSDSEQSHTVPSNTVVTPCAAGDIGSGDGNGTEGEIGSKGKMASSGKPGNGEEKTSGEEAGSSDTTSEPGDNHPSGSQVGDDSTSGGETNIGDEKVPGDETDAIDKVPGSGDESASAGETETGSENTTGGGTGTGDENASGSGTGNRDENASGGETGMEVEADPGAVVLEKWVESAPANGEFYVEGETIAYGVRVVNAGEVAIGAIAVSDSLSAAENGIIGKATDLKPGYFREHGFEYTVTAEDVRRGRVVNMAGADWQLPGAPAQHADSNPVICPVGGEASGEADAAEAEGCVMSLTGRGQHSFDYVRQYCPEHQAIEDQIKALISDAGADHGKKTEAFEQAQLLWTEALNAQYDAMLEDAGPVEAQLIEADRAKLFAWLDAERTALEALWPDDPEQVAQRMAEHLMTQCAELCCLAHAPSGERMDSVYSDTCEAFEEEEDAGDACRREAVATDTGAQVFEILCRDHAAVEAQVRALTDGADSAAARAKAWKGAAQLWMQALDIDVEMMCAGCDNPEALHAAQAAWTEWLEARGTLLSLIYPGRDDIAYEVLTQSARQRVLSLCAPVTKSVRVRRDKVARVTGVSTQGKRP